MNDKLKSILKYIFTVIVIALIIGLIANYTTWFTTREKYEVTFKLDGWITIGSVKFSDLPNLNLMLDSVKIDNIMKVSWRIINTGNKGIDKFESEPTILISDDMKIYTAKISEKSNNLKVCDSIIITNNIARIDSLGVFNSEDYMKLDFYIIDVKEKEITNKTFEDWHLQCKSVDLNIGKDISTEQETRAKKEKEEFDLVGFLKALLILILVFLIIFFVDYLKNIYKRNRRNKIKTLEIKKQISENEKKMKKFLKEMENYKMKSHKEERNESE